MFIFQYHLSKYTKPLVLIFLFFCTCCVQGKDILSSQPASLPQFTNWKIQNDRPLPPSLYLSLSDADIENINKIINNNLDSEIELLNEKVLSVLLSYYFYENNINKDSAWLEISGWKRSIFPKFGQWMWKSQNQDPRGYSSLKAMRNPKEDFVDFGKHFFNTPGTTVENSLKCRLPEKYQYFKKLFPEYVAYLDHPGIQCETIDDGFLKDLAFLDPVTGNQLFIGPVNSHTVKGFELLYATPGVGDPAEIAGHIVLRILLDNNPEAEKLGIENPNDIVVSFLANTTDNSRKKEFTETKTRQRLECNKSWLGLDFGQENEFDAYGSILQAVVGLTGGFLTTMDRQSLAQTVHHYTVFQDRNLIRYRLNINEEQKVLLLNRLFTARKNYNGRYYFFKENCGSILYRVVGEGLGNEKIASFDPIVTPPNALLSYMVREGVATRVNPSFLSYRQEGYVAQELLKQRYNDLKVNHPYVNWPKQRKMLSNNDEKRKEFFNSLLSEIKVYSELHQAVYHFSSIAQEAEKAFAHNELNCRNITTKSTSAIRNTQKYIISNKQAGPYALRTQSLIDEFQAEQELLNDRTGFEHTSLLNFKFSIGELDIDKQDKKNITKLSMALHLQDMGDRARLSMQRATSIVLAGTDLVFSNEFNDLEQWRFTGLHIRKFKERLDTVPSITSPDFRLGIGLNALDFQGIKNQEIIQSSLIGAELLANIFSSDLYSRYLYISLGIALDARWQHPDIVAPSIGDDHFRGAIPFEINGLWSFDENRRWQLRLKAGNNIRFGDGKQDKQSTMSLKFSGRVGEIKDRELVFFASSEYIKFEPENFTDYKYQLHQIGLSINPW